MTLPVTPLLGAIGLLACWWPGIPQQQDSRPQPDWPCVSRPDPSHIAVAEASGGQVFLLDPSEIGGSAPLMVAGQRHEETLFRAGGTTENGVLTFEVPVDSAVESLMVSVSLQCLQIVEVARPSGALVQAADEGVAYHQFQAVRLFTVPHPEPGAWLVRIAGRGVTSVVVQARGAIALDDASFVERGGRPGHQGWFPLATSPPLGRVAHLRARLSGPAGNVELEIEHQQISRVDWQPVTVVGEERDGEDRELIGEVVPRLTAFRVVVSGRDSQGYPFRRLHAPLFQPAP